MTGFIISAIITAIIIQGIFAYFMDQAAAKKGYQSKEVHAFAICFLFGILGCLYVIALPDKNLKKQNEEIINLLKCNLNGNNTTGKDTYNKRSNTSNNNPIRMNESGNIRTTIPGTKKCADCGAICNDTFRECDMCGSSNFIK